MSIDPAHLRYTAPPARFTAPPAPRPAPAAGAAVAGPVDAVEIGIPAVPPPDVLEQVSAAARCVEEMARNNRELHFHADEHSSRIIIEVRDMAGNVIKTIPPSKALDLMTAGAAKGGQWLA
jgi:flagellar protein FlaG